MLKVTDHEQIIIHYDEGSDWDVYKALWEHRMGPSTKNGGINESFLEEVTFELKHKGRKSDSQVKDKMEGSLRIVTLGSN